MTSARTGVLASLREKVGRLEQADHHSLRRVPLGHAAADAALKGGLALGVLHEVFAAGHQGAAATGFALALARRVAANRRFVLWIMQDFAARETGELAMNGFIELGLDPSLVIGVRAANAEMALRATADGLNCNALGVVITELWSDPKAFDAVASRKLTLAAGKSGVTGLMLRLAANPTVSTAETRWIVRAAHSPPTAEWRAWGAPVINAELLRNRHGQTGRWTMQWDCDDHVFHEPESHERWREQAPHSLPVVSEAADRSFQTVDVASRRRA